jgi:type IV secretory pathway component VirB8
MFWFSKPTKKRIIIKKPAMVFFAILIIIRAIVTIIISLKKKAIQIVKTNPSSIINIIDRSQTIKSMIWKRW